MLAPQINPIAFHILNVPISYYWLTYVFAFALAFILLHRAMKKKQLQIKEEQIYDILLLNLLAILIFARLFHVLFWGLSYYLSNPILIPQFWRGGLSFHGGLIGSILVTYLYTSRCLSSGHLERAQESHEKAEKILDTKKKKLPTWQIADILALVAILAHAIQRIVNLINQEIIGTQTSSPLCFTYSFAEGCRHIVQIYASIGNFILFAFLLYIYIKKPSRKEGLIFWLMIFLTGLGRFFLDFIREDSIYLGLKAGQWLAIPMIIIASYVLWKNYKNRNI